MKTPTTKTPFVQQTLGQVKRFYESLETSHRWMLLGAIVSTLVGLIIVGVWASAVPHTTLMSGRSYDDIMSSAASLEAAEIPYRLGEDGSSLEVPKGHAGRARMVIDQDKEPGLADLEYMQVGYTHQQQQWAFLRARETELARMINGFDPVESSRVSIVPEEESLFVGERRGASAAVFVKLRPGQKLANEQVMAITNMVSAAVEGLSVDHVTLTDHRGRIYTQRPDGNALDQTASTLSDQRRKMARDYEDAIRTNLMQILRSPTDFTVGVAVELDHTSAETRSRDIDPDTIVPVSEEFNEATSQKTATGGAPGVDANLPERVEEGANDDEMQSSEKLRTRVNNDFSTVETTEVRAPGELSRVSVAVVINQARLQTILSNFGEGAPDEAQFQEQIRESIRAAVGYQEARGDVVDVSFTPFAALELIEDTSTFAAAELTSYIPHALAALAMLLTFAFVVRPLIQKVTSVEIPDEEDEGDEAASARQAAEDRSLAERLRDLVDNFEPVEAEDLNRLVDHQSDAAAQVLRDWSKSNAS